MIARSSLLSFAKLTLPNYQLSEHLARVAAHLTALDDGTIRRLLITMPPRHGKSELCSVRFPSWLLGKHPDRQYVIASYAAELSIGFSRRVREIIRSATFRDIFPNVELKRDETSAQAWTINNHRGGLRAVGVGGTLTGFGASGLIIDDPVKSRAEADSETIREGVWQWFRSVAYTRLEPHGWLLIVMTRWHEDDLAGRLIRQAELDPLADRWSILHLPARSADGTPLWPERYDQRKLAEIEANIGPREWEALYQGRPRPPEGAIFNESWFKIVHERPTNLAWFRYWDLAASVKQHADYTASAACAMDHAGNIYIGDIIRGRWEWPDTRRRIIETALNEPDTEIGIESTGFQLAAVQDIIRQPELAARVVRPVHIDNDKKARALPWAARAEMGKLMLVHGPWVQSFIAECLSFPLGAHDDQVDAVSGAIAMIARTGSLTLGPAIW